jgi:hypothetical protein
MTSNARNFWNATIAILSMSGLIAVQQEPKPIEPAAVVIQAEPLSSGAADCDCGDNAEFGVYDQSFDVSRRPPFVATPETPLSIVPSETVPSIVPASIQWQPNIKAAVSIARKLGKIVHVHGVSKTCGPCIGLANNVFPQPPIVTRENERFVAVQVDVHTDQGRLAMSAFEVGADVPWDVFILPNGKIMRYFGAPQTVAGYLDRLTGVEFHSAKSVWPSYPNDGNGIWRLKGNRVGWQHVRDHANHRGKFPTAWLQHLGENDPDALQQLHSDDHENTVRWEFVPPVEATR